MTDAIQSGKKRSSRSRKPETSGKNHVVYIVKADGTDEEIAAACAEKIPGWEALGPSVQAETVNLMRAFWEHPTAPRYTAKADDNGTRALDVPEGENVTLNALRLIDALGSNSQEYINERLYDISRSYTGSDVSSKISAALAFVAGAKAEDPVQSSLAVQMAATHDAAMLSLRRFGTADYVEHAKMYGTIAGKLLNVYTRQAEVLAKLQRGGEQVIKHIHIDNRGGQAVVTDQVVTGGQHGEIEGQPHEQSALGAALLGHDPSGYGVPVANDTRQEALPAARRSVAGSA